VCDLFFGFGGRLPYAERQPVAALAGLKTACLRGGSKAPRLNPIPDRSSGELP
jgi:hypothetical protein